MKITLFSGDSAIQFIDCEIESTFVELVFVGCQSCGYGSGLTYTAKPRRVTTTLGYIIETEVEQKPPRPSDKTAFGMMLPNERQP